ncbi:MAG TPA: MarR family transcriptional regulator [Candidatus Tumulicola sp.]
MAKIVEAPVEASVENLLQATAQLVRRLRAEAGGDNLTWSQSVVLSQLEKRGPSTTADLARTESVKPQSMSATLAVLEEQGLVGRRSHPTDGRQILFALTTAGIAIRKTRSRLKRTWLSGALAQLTQNELRTLLSAAEPMRKLANS